MSWGYYLEIAGLDAALATHANAPTSMSTALVGLTAETWAQEESGDILTGEADTGGISVGFIDRIGALSQRLTAQLGTPVTRLTADIIDTTGTLPVESTSAFPSSGTLWIGSEAITYTGTTSTTFTGCTRGAFRTSAAFHEQAKDVDGGAYPPVYGYMPSLRGRRCWLTRYDLHDTGSATVVASGYVESIRYSSDDRRYTLGIASVWASMKDRQFLGEPFASGKVRGFISPIATSITVLLDSLDMEFPDVSSAYYPDPTGKQPRRYLLVGDDEDAEILAYDYTDHPTATVSTTPPGTTYLYTTTPLDAQGGDTVDLDTSPSQRLVVSHVEAAGTGSKVSFASPMTTRPSGGEDIVNVSVQYLRGTLTRRLYGTGDPSKIWEEETKVKELRVLEGSFTDILLRLLLSRDGDKSNHATYDTLPSGWGLALPSTDVDVSGIEALGMGGRDGFRRYLWTSPVKVQDMFRWYSQAVGAYVWGDRSGVITGQPLSAYYPGSTGATIAAAHVVADGLPELRIGEVKNAWQWGVGYPPIDQADGDPTETVQVNRADSIRVYGARALEESDDHGVVPESRGDILSSADRILSRVDRDFLVITLTVDYPLGIGLSLGSLVTLTWAHGPNLAGMDGRSSMLCEVTGVSPRDIGGVVELTLLSLYTDWRTALVAPAGVVESVDSVNLTIVRKAQAVTGLAPSGHEDVEYFLAGDKIRTWDRTDLGGTATNEVLLVTAVDVPTRTITVSALPTSFTLAVDDIVTLADYDDFTGLTTQDQRQGVYGAWADGSPPVVGSDDPYVWGT